MTSMSAREEWLSRHLKLAHKALDDAGVLQERVIDCVPEQALHCRIRWLTRQRDDAIRERNELRVALKRALPVLADDAMRLLESSGHHKHQGPDALCDCDCQNAIYAAETLHLAERALNEDSPNA